MAVKSFTTFGGADITAVFNGNAFGELQAISYHTTREKAAIWTVGSANARSVSRGKRIIAGSLVFIVFDANPILRHFDGARFLGDSNEEIYNGAGTAGALETKIGSDLLEDKYAMKPHYADQIPPFDVVLSAANEYGQRASMSIIGVELLNESGGFSIDDLAMEQQHTFIATHLTPWKSEDGAETIQTTLGAKK